MADTTPRGGPPACVELRTKAMYLPRGEEEPAGSSSTAQFWCLRTMAPRGPDGDLVSREACIPGRSCHRAEP